MAGKIKELFKIEDIFSKSPSPDIQIIKLDTEVFTPEENRLYLLTGKITEGKELEPDPENREDKIPLFITCDVLLKLRKNSEVETEYFFNVKNVGGEISASSIEELEEFLYDYLTFEDIKKNMAENIESEVFEKEIRDILIDEKYDYIIKDDAVNYYEDSEYTQIMSLEEYVEKILKPDAREIAEERIEGNEWIIEENKERILLNSDILDEYVKETLDFNKEQIKKAVSLIENLVKNNIERIQRKIRTSPFILIDNKEKIYIEKTPLTIKEQLPYILNALSLSKNPAEYFFEFCKKNELREDVIFSSLVKSQAKYNPFIEHYKYDGYNPRIKRNLLKLRDILIDKSFDKGDLLFKSSLFTNLYYYDENDIKFEKSVLKKINLSKEIIVKRLAESAASSAFFPYQERYGQYISTIIGLLNETFEKKERAKIVIESFFAAPLTEWFDNFDKELKQKALKLLFSDMPEFYLKKINNKEKLFAYLFTDFTIGDVDTFLKGKTENTALTEQENKKNIIASLKNFYIKKIKPFKEVTIKEINKQFAKNEGKFIYPHEAVPDFSADKNNIFKQNTEGSVNAFNIQALYISLKNINKLKKIMRDRNPETKIKTGEERKF